MFPTDKFLSKHIGNSFNVNCNNERIKLSAALPHSDPGKIVETVHPKNNYTQTANSIQIHRIQKRLKALEELNDQLYSHLCFLIESLPEIIAKTVQPDSDSIHTQINTTHKSHINGGKRLGSASETLIPCPTRRENDVLELLEKGYCAKEIATKLFISETTVITHKKNLKKKFNVKNTVELISKIRNSPNV